MTVEYAYDVQSYDVLYNYILPGNNAVIDCLSVKPSYKQCFTNCCKLQNT